MRIVTEINDNWRFAKLENGSLTPAKAIDPASVDLSWQKIYLPHTYNSEDSANSAYYRGMTCYRRRLALSKEYADKALYLEFGAANTIADVYVNGIFAGRHKGGYSAFRVNITDLVRFDKENLIAVLVDNSPTNFIAPVTEQGDFTKMGGPVSYTHLTLPTTSRV